MWRLYLVGGSLAFAEGRMGVDQILVAKSYLMHDFATGSFLVSLAASAGVVVVLVLVTWLLGMAIGRYNVVDVAWGLGFVLVAWVAFVLSAGDGDDARRVLVAVLVTLWGCRLAGTSRGGAGARARTPGTPSAARHAPRRHVPSASTSPRRRLWFISLPVQVASTTRGPAALALRRDRGLGRRLLLRERRRLAAPAVPADPAAPGSGHGPGALALHPPPELLR